MTTGVGLAGIFITGVILGFAFAVVLVVHWDRRNDTAQRQVEADIAQRQPADVTS